MTTKEQRDELRKCPFCGMEPIYREIEAHSHLYATFMPDHGGSFIVECVCGCGLIASEKAKVIEHWNTRAVLDSQQPASVDASVEPDRAAIETAIMCVQLIAEKVDTTKFSREAFEHAESTLQKLLTNAQPPAAEKGQADERAYEDGLLRAAEICNTAKHQMPDERSRVMAARLAEAIEQEAKGGAK